MGQDRDRMSVAASVLKKGVLQTLLPAVFPPLCAACSAESGQPMTLCPACWSELTLIAGPGCHACGRDIPGLGPGERMLCEECLCHQRAWDRGAAAFVYDGSGRRMILALKHGDRLDMVPMLARWMTRAGRAFLPHADVVVPVPLHWTRRLVRQANQSAELGRAIARLAAVRFEPGCLARVRSTRSQGGLNRNARAENLVGAFAVPRTRRGELAAARVVLVDDVLTTGATLDAAARALKLAGAARVDVLVAALVSRPSPSYLLAQTEEPEP